MCFCSKCAKIVLHIETRGRNQGTSGKYMQNDYPDLADTLIKFALFMLLYIIHILHHSTLYLLQSKIQLENTC